MSDKKNRCNRVLATLERTHWAIKPDTLEGIISIALRTQSDFELAAQYQASYQEKISAFEDVNQPSIAMINVFGPIFARADFFSEISGACTVSGLQAAIDDALFDDDVSAIILNLDSPGGQVTGIHDLASYIREACEIKPIYGYVSGLMCSACYWLGAACVEVHADITAIIGSIGVVAAWTDDKKAKEKAGLTDYEVVSSQSPRKRLAPTSKEGKDALQYELDGLADIFIDDVSLFRGVDREMVLNNFGEGGVLLAEDAMNVGMIDKIGSIRDLISHLTNEEITTLSIGENMAGGKYPTAAQRLAGKKATDPDDDKDLKDTTPDEDQTSKKGKKAKKAVEDPEDDDEDNREAIEDEDDDEASEEDEEKESPETCKAVAAFARSHPNLFNAIFRRGARRERRRIAGIEELEIKGFDKLVHKAKFSAPLTVADTALAAAKAEKKTRKEMLDGYITDATGFSVPAMQSNGCSNAKDARGFTAEENSALGIIKKAAESIKRGR